MEILLLVVGCVSTVLLVTSLCRRLPVPAPLLLLVVGAAVSYEPWFEIPELSAELVLFGLLPPLLYAAAVNTSLVDFKANLAAIGWLSFGFVLFCALGVAFVIAGLLPVPFAAAFAIGAIVAPPDAVAAVAVARRAGLPRRVVTILEGESLLNDATALVSLRTAIAALGASVTFTDIGSDLALAVVVGPLAGLLVAKVAIWLFRVLTDTPSSTTLTFLIPFAAWALAESVHASGVLAVVVAGLVVGHATPRVRSAPARVSTWMNWSTVQFILEHTVFLLIGLQTHQILAAAGDDPVSNGRIALVALAVLTSVIGLRIVYVMAIRPLLSPRHRPLSWQEGLVISWAGMRGVVTLAAALTLPAETPLRPVLLLIALVTVAGTLLIHGLTLPLVARRLGVRGPDPREDALQEAMVTQRSISAGIDALKTAAGPDDAELVDRMKNMARRRIDLQWERLGRSRDGAESTAMAQRRLRQAAMAGERRKLLEIRDKGFADHEVLSTLLTELDVEEATLVTREDREREVREAPARASGEAPCVHLGEVPAEVDFEAHGECADCVRLGQEPVELRMCLTCGHVACCDSSPGKHAALHFRRTGHPVMRSIEPGEHWRWCYVDQLHDEGPDD
ncbi:Na+/H+ antiporter [Micropruina sonneratiae]|uniref:Na+/H+ antiporter n=1 Tax=Micropruina sonneratiae TaxID=2986940 RepID=UPI002226F61C|nr:Na+/H+ antiporter [Micropruina sp. KQZ13P-5]MCW3157256.1 Na+/H+ antiporter [Micropruina sp. KQZ13P-5]